MFAHHSQHKNNSPILQDLASKTILLKDGMVPGMTFKVVGA